MLTEFGSRLQNMLDEQIADNKRPLQEANLDETAAYSSSKGMLGEYRHIPEARLLFQSLVNFRLDTEAANALAARAGSR